MTDHDALDRIDIDRVRAETPGIGDRVHVNNAGASPPPAPVLDAVVGYLRAPALLWQRAVLALTGIALLHQGTISDLVGVALLLLMLFLSRRDQPSTVAGPAP